MTLTLITPDMAEPQLDWLALTRALEAGHRLPRAQVHDVMMRRGTDNLLSRHAWIDGIGIAVKTADRVDDRRPRFGSPRTHRLLKSLGWRVNHKRVERIWKEENMQVRKKQHKKRRLPACRVVCSVRDILVEKEKQEKHELRAILILNDYFDTVLVHSDPSLVKIEETFLHFDP